MVYLRVTPLKGMQRFHVRGKLAPRYIGPFQIKARCGEVSYQLDLPPYLGEFHDVFQVSLLRKFLQVTGASHSYQKVDHQAIDLNHDLPYHEWPMCILDEDIRLTQSRKIKLFKVQWSNHSEEEATWEMRTILKESSLVFCLLQLRNLGDEILLRGKVCNTPIFTKSLNCGVNLNFA